MNEIVKYKFNSTADELFTGCFANVGFQRTNEMSKTAPNFWKLHALNLNGCILPKQPMLRIFKINHHLPEK